MANIDAGNGEWLRWSDDAPLTSETGDDRDRATLKVVNECSKPLHVQWVTSDGKLKNRRASRRARALRHPRQLREERAHGRHARRGRLCHLRGLEETPPSASARQGGDRGLPRVHGQGPDAAARRHRRRRGL